MKKRLAVLAAILTVTFSGMSFANNAPDPNVTKGISSPKAQTVTETGNKSPKTGDMDMYILLGAGALAGVGAVFASKRRRDLSQNA